ncbi:MAG TPA: hypothetical protein VFV38_20355 [Ktedonobacteraceae bacterium]|nr:hypothetical protein [Ktedonobacteraceae bacterium]
MPRSPIHSLLWSETIRSIYHKLGVNTRQEACDVARQYHVF